MGDLRFSRQTMLKEIGENGQQRFNRASVLIVGLGGLGAPVATYLTAGGIGRIGLADNDVVSLSNLQRQILYTESQVGLPKVECARERLLAISSSTQFDIWPEGLTLNNAAEIVSKYDVIVDCCDNFSTRFMIDDVCASLCKPWVHGSIGEFFGEVAVFGHKSTKRYSDIYTERQYLCSLPHTVAGVIGPTPGVVGALQASETMKIIADYGRPIENRLFTINLLTLETEIIEF